MENVKPNEKLLKDVRIQNEALAKATKYRKESPTFKDRQATSSDTLIEELQKNG